MKYYKLLYVESDIDIDVARNTEQIIPTRRVVVGESIDKKYLEYIMNINKLQQYTLDNLRGFTIETYTSKIENKIDAVKLEELINEEIPSLTEDEQSLLDAWCQMNYTAEALRPAAGFWGDALAWKDMILAGALQRSDFNDPKEKLPDNIYKIITKYLESRKHHVPEVLDYEGYKWHKKTEEENERRAWENYDPRYEMGQ